VLGASSALSRISGRVSGAPAAGPAARIGGRVHRSGLRNEVASSVCAFAARCALIYRTLTGYGVPSRWR